MIDYSREGDVLLPPSLSVSADKLSGAEKNWETVESSG